MLGAHIANVRFRLEQDVYPRRKERKIAELVLKHEVQKTSTGLPAFQDTDQLSEQRTVRVDPGIDLLVILEEVVEHKNFARHPVEVIADPLRRRRADLHLHVWEACPNGFAEVVRIGKHDKVRCIRALVLEVQPRERLGLVPIVEDDRVRSFPNTIANEGVV